MSIEAIKSAGMDYQAVQSNSVKVNTETAKSSEEAQVASATVASRTTDISTKETSADDSNASYEGQQTESQQATATEAVKKAVEEINRENVNKTVQFGVHEKTGRMTIKILDKNTRDVIKEFPADKTLDLIAKAWEMAGILVDEKR